MLMVSGAATGGKGPVRAVHNSTTAAAATTEGRRVQGGTGGEGLGRPVNLGRITRHAARPASLGATAGPFR
jgi:hypothetical protein